MRYCQRILERLDAHLDRELEPELAAEVDHHLEHCKECSLALETRRRVKEGLRRAVTRQEGMPAGLEDRLRQSREASAPRRHWPLAIAAGLLLALGGWALVRQSRLNSAQELSALKIGIDDHIHCALNRKYPEGIDGSLGADYIGLVPLVKSRVSGDFTIKSAHRCTLHGRNFVHLILTEPGTTLSVLLTPKEGERFGKGGTLHQARLENLSVAGFESGQYLAYVVSDLDSTRNSKIASELLPSLRQFMIGKG